MPVRALHTAGLEDAIVTPHGVDHSPGLFDRLRQGFLAVDILARLGGLDDRNRVPVVGGRNHDGVDIVPGDHLAEVAVGIATLVRAAALAGVIIFDDLLAASQLELVDIAGCDDVRAGRVEEGLHQVLALLAGADETQGDSFTRCVAGQNRTRNEVRQRHCPHSGAGGPAEKLAPAQIVLACHIITF